MAYPFFCAPSVKEFIADLQANGVTLKVLKVPAPLSATLMATFYYLERQSNGSTLTHPFSCATDRVPPSMIRDVCCGLELDPSKFGLPLG